MIITSVTSWYVKLSQYAVVDLYRPIGVMPALLQRDPEDEDVPRDVGRTALGADRASVWAQVEIGDSVEAVS